MKGPLLPGEHPTAPQAMPDGWHLHRIEQLASQLRAEAAELARRLEPTIQPAWALESLVLGLEFFELHLTDWRNQGPHAAEEVLLRWSRALGDAGMVATATREALEALPSDDPRAQTLADLLQLVAEQ